MTISSRFLCRLAITAFLTLYSYMAAGALMDIMTTEILSEPCHGYEDQASDEPITIVHTQDPSMYKTYVDYVENRALTQNNYQLILGPYGYTMDSLLADYKRFYSGAGREQLLWTWNEIQKQLEIIEMKALPRSTVRPVIYTKNVIFIHENFLPYQDVTHLYRSYSTMLRSVWELQHDSKFCYVDDLIKDRDTYKDHLYKYLGRPVKYISIEEAFSRGLQVDVASFIADEPLWHVLKGDTPSREINRDFIINALKRPSGRFVLLALKHAGTVMKDSSSSIQVFVGENDRHTSTRWFHLKAPYIQLNLFSESINNILQAWKSKERRPSFVVNQSVDHVVKMLKTLVLRFQSEPVVPFLLEEDRTTCTIL